jgi:hypothetical protein
MKCNICGAELTQERVDAIASGAEHPCVSFTAVYARIAELEERVGGMEQYFGFDASESETPERQKIFEVALSNLKDLINLYKLADEFEKVGLKSQTELLRKHAALCETSNRRVEYDKRRDAYNARKQALEREIREVYGPRQQALADEFEAIIEELKKL